MYYFLTVYLLIYVLLVTKRYQTYEDSYFQFMKFGFKALFWPIPAAAAVLAVLLMMLDDVCND